MSFVDRPQRTRFRRAAFQTHLWVGILSGIYLLVVSVSGAALVFRSHVQRAVHPQLFVARHGSPMDAATLMDRVSLAYPQHRLSGIELPTTERPTVLAYVTGPTRFETVLVDPVDARILGTLPEQSFIRWLQALHIDLLSGRTGRTVNGIGALCLLVMCLTGPIVWWQRSAAWTRGLQVRRAAGWKRVLWDLHGAAGIWSLLWLTMWALTGSALAFPSATRAIVSAVSPITVPRIPLSNLTRKGVTYPGWRELIDTARARVPDQYVARVVTPYNATAPFLVMFSASSPTPVSGAALTSIYLDQYSGEVFEGASAIDRTAGDTVMAWLAPVHIGNFGGISTRLVWAIVGLAPALLCGTGFTLWWLSICRVSQRGGLQ